MVWVFEMFEKWNELRNKWVLLIASLKYKRFTTFIKQYLVAESTLLTFDETLKFQPLCTYIKKVIKGVQGSCKKVPNASQLIILRYTRRRGPLRGDVSF